MECTWEKPGLAYFGLEFDPPKKFKGSMLDNVRNGFDFYMKKWETKQAA